jgi:hypothetical protein
MMMSTNFPPYNPYAMIDPDPRMGDFLYSTDTKEQKHHWMHDHCRQARTIFVKNGVYTNVMPATRDEWCELCLPKYQAAQAAPKPKPPKPNNPTA